ncbi:hypothetical protein [Hyphomonas sp.]|uniref:hypothetical protein n=1 Tax=Hyphomonas sp. TaxID=87 RepID=UPI003919B312
MSFVSKLKAGALSLVLAAAPVTGFAQSTYFPPTSELAQTADTLFEAALRRPAPRAGAPAFDAASLAALTGDAVSLTFNSSAPDAATGAWQLSGIALTLDPNAPKPFMTADSALAWGFDSAALAARLRGERLGETIRVFDRIELSGVNFDITDLSNTVQDVTAEISPDSSQVIYQDADLAVSRVVLGGLTLHPWTHSATEGEDAGVAAIRLLSAIARSFSLETLLFEDVVSTQSVETDEISGDIFYSYPRTLLTGYDRGRIEGQYQTGFSFNFDYGVDGLTPEGSELGAFHMSGRGGYGGWTGLDFSNLLAWGERGELPPITERNLFSFGRYVLDDMEFDLNGQPLFSVGRMEMTADEFAWFMPERISLGYQGLTVDIGGFLNFTEELTAGVPIAEGQPRPADIAALLERVGLSKFSGDGMLDLRWNSETGEGLIESRGFNDNLFRGLLRFDMNLPSYAALVPAFGPDGTSPDEEVIGSLFEKTTALRRGEFTMTDIGGLNAIASLIIELANSGYVDDPSLASFAGQTPDGLRMTASALMSMGAGAAAAEVPEARAWIAALSRFVTQGGTFSVRMDPKKPVKADHLNGPGTETPSGIVNLFGLTITHTPPAR